MCGFELHPTKQCVTTHEGHFGEPLTSVYQESSGLLARRSVWTPEQHSAVEHELMGRREGGNAGPYEKSYLDMAFGGDLYSLGETTKSLRIDDKPVETGSAQYEEAMAKITKAAQSIKFDSPYCSGIQKGVYENLDQKAK